MHLDLSALCWAGKRTTPRPAQHQATRSELEVSSELDDAAKSGSLTYTASIALVGDAAPAKSSTLNAGVERVGCAPKDRMIPYVEKFSLKAEPHCLMNRN